VTPAGPPRTNGSAPSAIRTNSEDLALAVPEQFVEAVGARVADLVVDRVNRPPDTWLSRDQAAEYLACDPQRISDLVHEGRLRPARDGRRVLFRREWLDEYVLEGRS
jgi:excisionase family DNA binding protein